MPRRLLRDGRIVLDDWRYSADGPDDGSSPLILKLVEWQSEREHWLAQDRRLGVLLGPSHKVEVLAQDLPRLELIGVEFPTANDGRGYSQARQLREQWKFRGELRAAGYVRRDQLFLMARAGFNSLEVWESDLEIAVAALSDFSWTYQPSNDAGLPIKPRQRAPDTAATA
ncbi:MAG TPA: DUF934 domain-containing protein [Steroidobacteraceae bacterium]|jgi:uncharacterized protein (DUF934 family)|nr:DUF934 domain-containing protein [Steroidobacteraceae bacterium]